MKMNEKTKKCPQCGHLNNKANHHCSNCGYKFEDARQEASKEIDSVKKKKKVMFLGIGLVTLILAGVIISNFVKEEEQAGADQEVEEVELTSVVEVEEASEPESESNSEIEEEEDKLDEIEEIFTYWELPDDELVNYTHSLSLAFSNTNKVEAEVLYASFNQGHYRYFFTVKKDEEASDSYHHYYHVDEVEKVEYDLSNSNYSFDKDEINEYLESEGLEYDIERLDNKVRYTIYEPNLETLEFAAIPDYPYDHIIQQIDYAAEDNELFEDYLIFMEEYKLLPQQ